MSTSVVTVVIGGAWLVWVVAGVTAVGMGAVVLILVRRHRTLPIAVLAQGEHLDRDEVAQLVHELRSPLTAVVGHLELAMAQAEIDEGTRARLATVQRNVERMGMILNADRSAVVAPPDLRECDVLALVEERLSAAVPELLARNLAVAVEAPDRPILMCGDWLTLGQLVDNLVGNAIKYNQDGGWIDVRLRRTVAGKVTLSIRNSGTTADAGEASSVFDAGYRSPTALKSGVEGAGLGLAIASGIVAQHGGVLSFDSWSERGVTRVVATFPRSTPLSDLGPATVHGTAS